MKRPRNLASLAFVWFCAILLPTAAQTDSDVSGMWQGALTIQGMKLRIVFHLAPISGGYRATMDSPDQGAKGIPTDTVIVRLDSIRILMRMIGGQFVGSIQDNDTVITGSWSQSGVVFPLELTKSVVAVTFSRPQQPHRPYPYDEAEVSFRNSKARITIAGALTTPKGPGPFSAVVLITGSGAQDRDETIFEHKPFLVIADHLTRCGIAVLRCDDRGTGKSTGTFRGATSEDLATDIEAAVEFLRTQKSIRHDKIGLLGHSEGGVIAPMIAAKDPKIAFIVLLAGPSIPGTEIIILQDSLISLANGAPAEAVSAGARRNRAMFEISRREPDTTRAREAIAAFLYADAVADNPGGRPDSLLQAEAQRTARRITDPWMRFFLHYDPTPALRTVRCPILALNGEKDLQVPAESNLRGIERAGVEGKNDDVTVRKMPGLNHLFQTATTGSPMEYAGIEQTMDPTVLTIVADWIAKRVP